MKPFWRPDPLTDSEELLLDAVLRAHACSVERANASSYTMLNTYGASGDYVKALAGALMTLGGPHAPIAQTIEFFVALDRPELSAELIVADFLRQKFRVPGWGNSFEKTGKDTLWAEVDELLREKFPAAWQRLESVTAELHRHGKKLYPNPSAYTAMTAILLRIPPQIAPWLFVQGRLDAWTARIQKNFLSRPELPKTLEK